MTTTMSIATALRRAKRLKGLIAEEDRRARNAAVFVESKEPAFSFQASVEKKDALTAELVNLETAIALANASATLPDGMPIFQAIRQCAELKGQIAFYSALPVRAKEKDIERTSETVYDRVLEKYVQVEKQTVHVSAITEAKKATIIESLQAEFDKLNEHLEDNNRRVMVRIS